MTAALLIDFPLDQCLHHNMDQLCNSTPSYRSQGWLLLLSVISMVVNGLHDNAPKPMAVFFILSCSSSLKQNVERMHISFGLDACCAIETVLQPLFLCKLYWWERIIVSRMYGGLVYRWLLPSFQWLLIDRRRLILRDRYCSLNLLSQSMLVILNSGLLLVKAICRPSEFTLQTDTFLQSEPANNPLEYVILE